MRSGYTRSRVSVGADDEGIEIHSGGAPSAAASVWYVVATQTTPGQIVTTGFSSDPTLAHVTDQWGTGFTVWQFDTSDAQMAFIQEFQARKAPPVVLPPGTRKVSGGMSTTTKLVLAGAGLCALYLITKRL